MNLILITIVKFFLLIRLNDLSQDKPVLMGRFPDGQSCLEMAKQNIEKEGKLPGIKYQCVEIIPWSVEEVIEEEKNSGQIL